MTSVIAFKVVFEGQTFEWIPSEQNPSDDTNWEACLEELHQEIKQHFFSLQKANDEEIELQEDHDIKIENGGDLESLFDNVASEETDGGNKVINVTRKNKVPTVSQTIWRLSTN